MCRIFDGTSILGILALENAHSPRLSMESGRSMDPMFASQNAAAPIVFRFFGRTIFDRLTC